MVYFALAVMKFRIVVDNIPRAALVALSWPFDLRIVPRNVLRPTKVDLYNLDLI